MSVPSKRPPPLRREFVLEHATLGWNVAGIGRLDPDGRRFIARADDRDTQTIELLGGADEPIGRRVYVRSFGFAMGGGCEIALACHLVVADKTAKFALSEVKVGLIAGAGGVVRLPRTVPLKLANEMILTGRRLTADEGLAYGLVNRVTEAGQAIQGARALAKEILESSPTSVRISLQVMEETRGIADVVDAVTHHSPALDDLMVSEDMIEGLTAFAQKRAPRWRNR